MWTVFRSPQGRARKNRPSLTLFPPNCFHNNLARKRAVRQSLGHFVASPFRSVDFRFIADRTHGANSHRYLLRGDHSNRNICIMAASMKRTIAPAPRDSSPIRSRGHGGGLSHACVVRGSHTRNAHRSGPFGAALRAFWSGTPTSTHRLLFLIVAPPPRSPAAAGVAVALLWKNCHLSPA